MWVMRSSCVREFNLELDSRPKEEKKMQLVHGPACFSCPSLPPFTATTHCLPPNLQELQELMREQQQLIDEHSSFFTQV